MSVVAQSTHSKTVQLNTFRITVKPVTAVGWKVEAYACDEFIGPIQQNEIAAAAPPSVLASRNGYVALCNLWILFLSYFNSINAQSDQLPNRFRLLKY